MTKGPCLCGDPACHSCGNPGAIAWEAAIENLTDELNALGLNEYELELFKTVGIEALNAHREANKDRQAQTDAEQTMHDNHKNNNYPICRNCGGSVCVGYSIDGLCTVCSEEVIRKGKLT